MIIVDELPDDAVLKGKVMEKSTSVELWPVFLNPKTKAFRHELRGAYIFIYTYYIHIYIYMYIIYIYNLDA